MLQNTNHFPIDHCCRFLTTELWAVMDKVEMKSVLWSKFLMLKLCNYFSLHCGRLGRSPTTVVSGLPQMGYPTITALAHPSLTQCSIPMLFHEMQEQPGEEPVMPSPLVIGEIFSDDLQTPMGCSAVTAKERGKGCKSAKNLKHLVTASRRGSRIAFSHILTGFILFIAFSFVSLGMFLQHIFQRVENQVCYL